MIPKPFRRNRRRNPWSNPRSRRLQTIFGITVLVLFATISASANVTLPTLLADHMVVQRGLPVHIWGTAAPHESITVKFRGETKSGSADDLGRWGVSLSPREAGGAFQLSIIAAKTISPDDVLGGHVWVASGQSNMEFPMTGL